MPHHSLPIGPTVETLLHLNTHKSTAESRPSLKHARSQYLFTLSTPSLFPSQPSPALHFRRSLPPLPLIQLMGLGERCKLPQRVRADPADK